MNFRLIALASCVALGSIAFGGKAQAQKFTAPTDTVLTSSGTVAPSCTVSEILPGSMTIDVPGKILSTTNSLGTPARFNLTCNKKASVVVRGSTTSGAILSGTSTLAAVLTGATDAPLTSQINVDSAIASTSTPDNFVLRAVVLNHTLTETDLSKSVAPGTYTFTTLVNITPD